MTPIRLVVVDDHIVFREGLRALLRRVEDIEIVGEAATTRKPSRSPRLSGRTLS